MLKPYTTHDIINSLDGASKAEPSQFLYTRIQSRLYEEKRSPYYAFFNFISRPAFAVAISLIFILINGYMLASKIKEKDTTYELSQPLAVEYIQHIINPYETNESPE